MEQTDGKGRRREIVQHRLEMARRNMLGHLIAKDSGEPDPGQSGVNRRLGAGNGKSGSDRDRFTGFCAGKCEIP